MTNANISYMPIKLPDGTIIPMTERVREFGDRVRERARRERGTQNTQHNYALASQQISEMVEATNEAIDEAIEVVEATSLTRQEIAQRINAFVPVALQFLEDVIAGKYPASIALRAKYADKHLARAGYGIVLRSTNLNMNQTLEASDIENIKQRALAAQNNEITREDPTQQKFENILVKINELNAKRDANSNVPFEPKNDGNAN